MNVIFAFMFAMLSVLNMWSALIWYEEGAMFGVAFASVMAVWCIVSMIYHITREEF